MFNFFKNKIEKVEVENENPVILISDYLEKDNLEGLTKFVHDHKKEVHMPEIEKLVLPKVEKYLIEHIQNSEVGDGEIFDKIYKLSVSHIIPLEIFKENIAVQSAINHAIIEYKKESNLSFQDRIKELPFYKEVA